MDQGFPKFELEQVFRGDAADIIAAREKARIMHHGKDIRAAGDEVELAVRRVLRRKLPSSYYIGHGHIVDQNLHTSPQLDVIVADNAGSPVLFQAENGSEYFPYEGVYAIGEVKSFYEKSKRYIHKFAEQLTNIQSQLEREAFLAASRHRLFDPPYGSPPYGNPLFSFMFFVDAGDFRIEDVTDLYQTQPKGKLPNIVCLLNKGLIVNALTLVEGNEQQIWQPLQPIRPSGISLVPAFNDNYPSEGIQDHWVLTRYQTNDQQLAAHFGVLYSMLATHLRECQLTAPNLVKYISKLFGPPASTIIA